MRAKGLITDGIRGAMKGLLQKRGLTLLEMAVTMAASALAMAPLGVILWQTTVIPAETASSLNVGSQVRNVDIGISDDARSAQTLVTGDRPIWATSAWTDFTVPFANYHTVSYAWDATGDKLIRDVEVEGGFGAPVKAGRFINRYEDVSIGFNPARSFGPALVAVEWAGPLDLLGRTHRWGNHRGVGL